MKRFKKNEDGDIIMIDDAITSVVNTTLTPLGSGATYTIATLNVREDQ